MRLSDIEMSALSQKIIELEKNNGDPNLIGQYVADVCRSFMPPKKTNNKPLFEALKEKICFFGTRDCWYFYGVRDSGGYGMLTTVAKKTKKAHRVAWELANGKIPKGMFVLHKCDTRNCVNPDHLFLGNQLENMRDCVRKKRHKHPPPLYGKKNPMSKLTRKDVEKMREIRKTTGESHKKIAKRFNVSTMTAYRAVERKLWK